VTGFLRLVFSTVTQRDGITGRKSLDCRNEKSHCKSSVVSEAQMKLLLMMACMLLSSGLPAQNCVENAHGKTVCSDGKTAAAVNPNSGKAAVAQKNKNGVTTTRTSTGGKAKTKNGMGVATGPGGTTCAKGLNNQGCVTPKK
jgi:hypothetical protein